MHFALSFLLVVVLSDPSKTAFPSPFPLSSRPPKRSSSETKRRKKEVVVAPRTAPHRTQRTQRTQRTHTAPTLHCCTAPSAPHRFAPAPQLPAPAPEGPSPRFVLFSCIETFHATKAAPLPPRQLDLPFYTKGIVERPLPSPPLDFGSLLSPSLRRRPRPRTRRRAINDLKEKNQRTTSLSSSRPPMLLATIQ